MPTPPEPEFVEPPELERVGRFQKWQNRVLAQADILCVNTRNGKPACANCIKTSYFLAQQWIEWISTDQEMADRKARAGKNMLVLISLHTAYEVMKSVFDPDYTLAVQGYGSL